MATQAHCAYCFEALTAKLENRPALSLREVEDLWAKYNADPTADDPNAPDDDAEDDEAEAAPGDATADSSPYRPAAISRLLAPSPASNSSSSVQSTSSTPSGASEASSATSKSSSRSSFFSRANETRETATPLFVTWNVASKANGTPLAEKRLRGCIGTFEPKELEKGLGQYAIISALEDHRFHPIALSDLPTLSCGVTLLTDFEPAAHPMDWELGTHGLRISFTHHGRKHGATYLPDVAREQGWTKEETIVSLMRKAGWGGRKEDWKKVELGVVRYQGRKVEVGWGEWVEWRGWVGEARKGRA